MVMNKKGFMRIVEATVAVLIILAAMLLLSSHRTGSESLDLGKNLPQYLDEIANDGSLREEILHSPNESETEKSLENFVRTRMNPATNYYIEICELSEPCYLDPYPDTEQEVFAAERVISTTLDEPGFSPKKIKIFVWLKESR